MKIVLGLVGEIGSGKETFVNFLRKILPNKSIYHIKSSDILKETLDLWDIPKNRENLQKMAITMDENFGQGTLTHAVIERIKQNPAEIVVFDGMRWESDVKMIKSFPNSLLIYITANQRTRFERIKKRKEKKGEEKTSFEQFQTQEQAKTETSITKIAQKADYKIDNNGTLKEFEEKVRDFYNNKIKNQRSKTNLKLKT